MSALKPNRDRQIASARRHFDAVFDDAELRLLFVSRNGYFCHGCPRCYRFVAAGNTNRHGGRGRAGLSGGAN